MRPYFDNDHAAAIRESNAQASARNELDEANHQAWKRDRDEHYAALRAEDEALEAASKESEEERLRDDARFYAVR